jgi:3-deoxy-manno-octulosonate cytidylyltransferase (CMP-KDO synthetase)
VHASSAGSAVDFTHPLQVVALIPARYGSTRFPGKPLADIDGRPMIEHVYRRAESALSVTEVIVATDDLRIATRVSDFGGRVRLTKATHQSGTDRLAEVVAKIECDIAVNVQGDEPLIDPRAIDQAIAPLLDDPTVQMTTLYKRITQSAELMDPNVVKVVVDRGGYALYFYRHIGLYAYRRSVLLVLAGLDPTPLERAEKLEQLRALEHGIRIKAVETPYDSLSVDTPEDLAAVRRLLAAPASG